MTRILILSLLISATFTSSCAQSWKQQLQNEVKNTLSDDDNGLTQGEAGSGLREALIRGIEISVDNLSKPDGYFRDELIRIIMPEEARKAESYLRKMGQDKLVDDAIEAMNRAAEGAAEGARDIFIGAVKEITFQDALALLSGGEDAATRYLEDKTRAALHAKFEPVIRKALEEVNATKYWDDVFTTYNKVPLVKKVNPDLGEHVTSKAIDGLFVKIADQEKEIRENPAARTTELLQKVFGK